MHPGSGTSTRPPAPPARRRTPVSPRSAATPGPAAARRRGSRRAFPKLRPSLLFVGGLEAAQDVVAAARGVVHCRLRILLAGEHGFHFLFDHLAALHVVAE